MRYLIIVAIALLVCCKEGVQPTQCGCPIPEIPEFPEITQDVVVVFHANRHTTRFTANGVIVSYLFEGETDSVEVADSSALEAHYTVASTGHRYVKDTTAHEGLYWAVP